MRSESATADVLTRLRDKLIAVGELLVDQRKARVVVEPRKREKGFWFGGGNICRAADGSLWLTGRFRNGGDARHGTDAGVRGAELALYRSTDQGESFQHIFSLFKDDLSCGGAEVMSIEGASLLSSRSRVWLFVSTEKALPYPEEARAFQKQGTGIWTIDVLSAPRFEELATAKPTPVLRSDDPAWLHVKDPVIFRMGRRCVMLYCNHPYSWTSSNTGCAMSEQPTKRWRNLTWSVLPRGPAWDVAVCRLTERMPLPPVGVLRGLSVSLYFYDGAECVHDHGGTRPRGYSCEEIGGLAAGLDDEFPRTVRLSEEAPLFMSPYGTGCSRYVRIFDAGDSYIATWQQSQADVSQCLVANRVAKRDIERVLAS